MRILPRAAALAKPVRRPGLSPATRTVGAAGLAGPSTGRRLRALPACLRPRTSFPMGNYVIEAGKYLSANPSDLGNFVSADSEVAAWHRRLAPGCGWRGGDGVPDGHDLQGDQVIGFVTAVGSGDQAEPAASRDLPDRMLERCRRHEPAARLLGQ